MGPGSQENQQIQNKWVKKLRIRRIRRRRKKKKKKKKETKKKKDLQNNENILYTHEQQRISEVCLHILAQKCCFLDMPLRGWTSQCQSQPDDLLVPPACLLSLHGGLHDNALHYIRLYAS
jgi:hypothetical protein